MFFFKYTVSFFILFYSILYSSFFLSWIVTYFLTKPIIFNYNFYFFKSYFSTKSKSVLTLNTFLSLNFFKLINVAGFIFFYFQKSIFNFFYISLNYFIYYNNFVYNIITNFLFFFEILIFKSKNHSHQIIPYYFSNYIFNINTSNSLFNSLFSSSQFFFSSLPFYYLLILSFSSLFFLFFIFLNYENFILHFNSVYIFNFFFLTYPINFIFYSFYFSLFLYIFIFLYSFFKFMLYIFNELKCKYIYNNAVENQYLLGIFLFILSEIMLFFAFFWAFFHVSLSPNIFIGNCWPPLGITTLNPLHIPLLNTIILLSSGITINWFYFTLKRISYINYRFFFFNSLYGFSFKKLFYTFSDFWFFSYSFSSLYFYIHFVIYIFFNFLSLFFFFNFFLQSFFFNLIKTFYLYYLYNLFKFNVLYISYNYTYYSYYFIFVMNYFKKILYLLPIFSIYSLIITFILDKFFFFKSYFIKSFEDILISLTTTIYLGFLFLGFQNIEYVYYSSFSIDNIYGTTFYLLTSLHGFHVFVGLISLLLCYSFLFYLKYNLHELNKNYFDNFLITFSVIYWHFVDLIWLFLYIFIYIW